MSLIRTSLLRPAGLSRPAEAKKNVECRDVNTESVCNPQNRPDLKLAQVGIPLSNHSRQKPTLTFRHSTFVGEDGFEPPKTKSADLQSAPFGHSGIPPINFRTLFLQLSPSSPPLAADFTAQKSAKFLRNTINFRLLLSRANLHRQFKQSSPILKVYFTELFAQLSFRADGGIRTPDQLITNQLLWPTELHRQMFLALFSFSQPFFGFAKIGNK